MKRMIITLLVIILACTGCGNAVNVGDSQGQKENAEETVKAVADLSEDIPQESAMPDLPEEGEMPEDITSLLEDVVSDEESKDTDRADLSKKDVLEMKEDVTNEDTGVETNIANINNEAKNTVESRSLDTQSMIYEITNGNTGKRITLNDSQQLECMDALLENMTIQKEESIQSDAEKTVGYLYCIRILNENGDVSKTITLNGSNVEINGKYYIVESTESLVAYLDYLYK